MYCEVCKETYDNSYYAIRHIKTKKHLQIKNIHKCNKCNKIFSNNTILQQHLLTTYHKNFGRIYECIPCNYTTKLTSSYNIHCKSKKHQKNNDEQD